MKRTLLLLGLFVTASLAPAVAADPAPPLYWYHMTVGGDSSSRTFTGSSPVDHKQMASRLGGTEAITLQNLRRDNGLLKPDFKWLPSNEGTQVIVPARAVCYLMALPGDPMVTPP